MAALSPTDAWAVGEANLTQRWDGEKWTVVGLADPRRVLKSVAIASAAATWVVGYQAPRAAFDTYANRTPVIERWDGMVWHVERAPGFHGRGGWLNGVAAIAPDNAWAVGGQLVPTRRVLDRQQPLPKARLVFRSLIEHWDGRAWQIVPSADVGPAAVTNKKGWGIVPASDNELLSIAAVSSDDVWAVGAYGRPLPKAPLVQQPTIPTRYWPLSEHWNGVQWRLGPHVSLSVVPESRGQLPLGFDAVGAEPSGVVLTVAQLQGEVWRFTPGAWQQSFAGTSFSTLAVAVIGHDDAWIAGPSSGDPAKPVGFHWDGQGWTEIQLPAVGWVDAVAASTTNDVWAVGGLASTGTKYPLVGPNKLMLHYTC